VSGVNLLEQIGLIGSASERELYAPRYFYPERPQTFWEAEKPVTI